MVGRNRKLIPENLGELSPQLRYYYTHREQVLKQQSNNSKENWKNRDKEKTKFDWNEWAKNNPEMNKARMKRWRNKHGSKWQHDRYKKRRLMVINYYGGKCVCCGESIYEFLEIDHIDCGGTKQRIKLKRRGTAIVEWIIHNGYPNYFQILCANCNRAKNNSGKQFCPIHHPEQYGETEQSKKQRVI